MPRSQSGRPVGSGTRVPHRQSESSSPRTYPPPRLPLSGCSVLAALCSGGPHPVLYESLAWQEEDQTPGRPVWPTPAKGREERRKGDTVCTCNCDVVIPQSIPPPPHYHTKISLFLLLLPITHRCPFSSPSHTGTPPPPPPHHTRASLFLLLLSGTLLLLPITHGHPSSSSLMEVIPAQLWSW